ncbi:MAG TPA: hypothetical protein VK477_13270 [Acidobacteriota bacterium]|nr:hypothetical protein [Acidobacteriota bacterium]
MNNRTKLIACGTSALFAAVLCLQAQTSTSSQPSTTPPPTPPPNSNSPTDRQSPDQTNPGNSEYGRSHQPSTPSDTPNADRFSTTPSSSGANSSASNNSLRGSSSEYSSQSAGSMQSSVTGTASAQTETQVTTIVQQIDQQGPAVVDRAVTQFSSVTCTEDNARKLIEALHSGNEVTLTSDKGESVTFKPTSQLGYGEAYLAMSLAAETLRQNGITGCATPEQWRSVLIGGPLSGATSTSAISSTSASASSKSNFPGILVLRQQGQGWGQIAQTSHIQLGTVVSSAQSSLNLSNSTSSSTRSGLSSSTGEMDQSKSSPSTSGARTQSTDDDDKNDKPKKKHWWQRDHSKDDKTNPDKKDSEPDKEDPNKS